MEGETISNLRDYIAGGLTRDLNHTDGPVFGGDVKAGGFAGFLRDAMQMGSCRDAHVTGAQESTAHAKGTDADFPDIRDRLEPYKAFSLQGRQQTVRRRGGEGSFGG